MTPVHTIRHTVCTNKEDQELLKYQLLNQAKRDYKLSKINRFLLHKNMHPILILVLIFLVGYGKDQILFGVLIQPYYYVFFALALLHPIYEAWMDRKIKRKIKREIDQSAYFSTTGTIKKIISHHPKDNLIEFEIKYLHPKFQTITRVFKHFYQADIYNPNDFKNRESYILSLINQPITLYLSAESETLIQLYLLNSTESAVYFKKGKFFQNRARWWFFHHGPLLSPICLHPDDLRKIYLYYSEQDQHWHYSFHGEAFENITLHSQIINLGDFDLALSQTLPSFNHVQYQTIKANHPEHPQLIWENKNPLSHAEKRALHNKLAVKLSLYAAVLSVLAITVLYSTLFKVIDDIILNILLGLLSTAVIAISFIYLFYALCQHRHYLAADQQVALFQIQPRRKENLM